MPWDSPFMSLVRKGVPISALLHPWPDPRGSSVAPPCEVPPSEVVSPGETPVRGLWLEWRHRRCRGTGSCAFGPMCVKTKQEESSKRPANRD
eukprot:2129716-Amphidinium_carterae.1